MMITEPVLAHGGWGGGTGVGGVETLDEFRYGWGQGGEKWTGGR